MPIAPNNPPATIKIEFKTITNRGAFSPSALAFFCRALMYMIGGNTNIILDPNTPPATLPTTPMSVNLEARKEIRRSRSEAIRFIPPILGTLCTAWFTNQFLILKKIKGKEANTDVPKANRAKVPKGSLGEKEFKANEAELVPNKVRPRAMVPM